MLKITWESKRKKLHKELHEEHSGLEEFLAGWICEVEEEIDKIREHLDLEPIER
jgi:hypothetical protein